MFFEQLLVFLGLKNTFLKICIFNFSIGRELVVVAVFARDVGIKALRIRVGIEQSSRGVCRALNPAQTGLLCTSRGLLVARQQFDRKKKTSNASLRAFSCRRPNNVLKVLLT